MIITGKADALRNNYDDPRLPSGFTMLATSSTSFQNCHQMLFQPVAIPSMTELKMDE